MGGGAVGPWPMGDGRGGVTERTEARCSTLAMGTTDRKSATGPVHDKDSKRKVERGSQNVGVRGRRSGRAAERASDSNSDSGMFNGRISFH